MIQGNNAGKKQQIQKEYQNASRYLMQILNCALNDVELKDAPVNCTWEQVWELAEQNQIEALTGKGIQRCSAVVPVNIRDSGKREQNATLYRQICFDIEREQIEKKLKDQKIAYVMLKGINIQEYYPEAGTRWMCDNDILCGYIQPDEAGGYRIRGNTEAEVKIWQEKVRNDVQSVMENSGFSLKQKGICHDAYIKQPMFKFEMHHQLFQKAFDEEKAHYYSNPWKRVIPDEEKGYQYHFSKEDEYIYFITHGYKHFSRSGSGIRTLVDVYVCIKNNPTMNWEYITSQLEILNLKEFEALLRNTALHAFAEDEELTTEEWGTIFYMIGSGTYGTSVNRIRHCLEALDSENKNGNKQIRHYLKNRLWLKEDVVKDNFPFFYRHRFLRFFLPGYRLIKGIFLHPKTIWSEWRILCREGRRQ